MAGTVTFKLSEEERIAVEYFKKMDIRRTNPDVFRSLLIKAYSKIPKDRREQFEIELKKKENKHSVVEIHQ